MTYFDELIQINNFFMQEENNIRLYEEEIQIVCNKLNAFYSSEFNLDEFIKLCIILFNMQIFYDGNSRTIITYIAKILNDNGYCIDVQKATEELILLKGFFPVMYDLDEELDEKDINNIKKNIIKKKVKE